jgi:hypothetical protein
LIAAAVTVKIDSYSDVRCQGGAAARVMDEILLSHSVRNNYFQRLLGAFRKEAYQALNLIAKDMFIFSTSYFNDKKLPLWTIS